MFTPLTLDTFVFDEGRLEVPEHFGDTGGAQRLAQHDFPGGIRTQKSFGYFPGALHWRAISSAPDAADRVEQLKRLTVAGNEIKLTWGMHTWYGRVAHIHPIARHDFQYEFNIEFWPRVDMGSPGPGYPPIYDGGLAVSLHILALQNLILNGPPQGFGFAIVAAELGPVVGDMNGVITTAALTAGGAIAGISVADKQQVYQSSLSALAVCQPHQQSNDPTESSPANDAAAHIQAIQNIFVTASQPVAVIQTINPNLPVLAAQYYGDASAWRTIATANGLADPQPVGSFNLVIPQQSM